MQLISVIIPSYNAEQTIQSTIESVLNQTYSHWELIIVNDGSTDSTLDLVQGIKDERIQIFTYPNSGPNPTRNRGFSHACGQYISFLDADDQWSSDKLEKQLQAIKDSASAKVAYSWTNWVDEKGTLIRRGSYKTANGDVFAKLLLIDFIESGSNPLIFREAFAEAGGFDETLPAAQDWDMWLRLAAKYHFVCVECPQIFYRVSPGSWSSNVERMEVASLRVIKRSLAEAPESVRRLRRDIFANRYKGLVHRTLQGDSQRSKGIIASRFLWQTLKYDPSFLRARVLAKVLGKIIIMTLLPPRQAQTILNKAGKLSNIDALMGYLCLEPY
ncbi:MAG: glycosyltransferase [Spirulinaceae cyanobacterium]